MRLILGDCREVMAGMDACSVDAVVTDPPYELGFMGKAWDARGVAYDPATWAAALRVLKPGGHLVAFGAPRTAHRLACAIEDAGFEIRDTLMWLFGSGFPKSLDVSKAIDKAAGAERELTRAGMVKRDGYGDGWDTGSSDSRPRYDAPATPEAERWQGWGTALKPAYEPIILARKPLAVPSVNVLQIVELELRHRGVQGEIRWVSGDVVKGAELSGTTPSSSATALLPVEETSADPAVASGTARCEPPTENFTTSGGDSGPPRIQNAPENITDAQIKDYVLKFWPPTETHVSAAESRSHGSSPSITSTGVAPSIDETLDATCTRSLDVKDSPADTACFAGIATGLSGSRATVLIRQLADGRFVWPAGIPRQITGSSTVAANVLAYGTGALNVDGCRIEGVKQTPWGAPSQSRASAYGMGKPSIESDGRNPNVGRWPANVVLDEDSARLLDLEAGDLPKSGGPVRGTEPSRAGYSGGWGRVPGEIYGDSGGPSRFYYTAKAERGTRPSGFGDVGAPSGDSVPNGPMYNDAGGPSRFYYTAKASRSEREAGLEDFEAIRRSDGRERDIDNPRLRTSSRRNDHPTVKPVSLMRWLCRLVTPPGGVVLDPFMGSGSTRVAAIAEGLDFIGIDLEPRYVEIAQARAAQAGFSWALD